MNDAPRNFVADDDDEQSDLEEMNQPRPTLSLASFGKPTKAAGLAAPRAPQATPAAQDKPQQPSKTEEKKEVVVEKAPEDQIKKPAPAVTPVTAPAPEAGTPPAAVPPSAPADAAPAPTPAAAPAAPDAAVAETEALSRDAEMDVALSGLRRRMKDENEALEAIQAERGRGGAGTGALGGEADGAAAAAAAELEMRRIGVRAYDPDAFEAERNLALASKDACFVRRGEDTPAEPHMTARDRMVQERVAALNFPARPEDWPAMMMWPSQRDLDILERRKDDRAFIQAYADNLMKMNTVMRQRADQLRDFLDEHRDTSVTLRERHALWRKDRGNDGLGPDARQRRAMIKHGHDPRDYDPQRGIRFALMLDPAAIGANSHLVANWAESVIRTQDGCNVYAGKDEITFRVDTRYRSRVNAVTDQAITLSIREGLSRGWNSFEVHGTKRFALAYEKKALEMGISAKITYRNVLGIKKTIKVDPPLPGLGERPLQWVPRLAGAAPAGGSDPSAVAPASATSAPRTSRNPQAAPATVAAGAAGVDDADRVFGKMKTMPAATPAPAAPADKPAAPEAAGEKMRVAPAAAQPDLAHDEIDRQLAGVAAVMSKPETFDDGFSRFEP